jgi:hypothetical protein
MANATKPEAQPANKTAKAKRVPPPLASRVTDQLTKAVLSKKISKEELTKLVAHVTKLEAFVDA